MNGLPRSVFLVCLCGLAVVLGAAALAWACVPQGSLVVNPSAGPGGAQATVTGRGLNPGPVDIRWDGAGADRPRLATAVGPDFNNVPITIPADTPGYHYVVAVGPNPDPEHTNHNSAVAPFCISAPGTDCGGQPSTGSTPTGSSNRARAIAKCKKRYRGGSRRAVSKRKACIRRAQRRYRA